MTAKIFLDRPTAYMAEIWAVANCPSYQGAIITASDDHQDCGFTFVFDDDTDAILFSLYWVK